MDYFVDNTNNSIKNRSIFQERINGIVSYYGSASKVGSTDFPIENPTLIIPVPMSNHQWKQYVIARKDEMERERIAKHSKASPDRALLKVPSKESGSYKINSRQACNFALPENVKRPKWTPANASKMDSIYQNILNNLPKDVLTTDLANYSPKMDILIKKLLRNSNRISLVYSNFKSIAGIGTISKILEHHGWVNILHASQHKGGSKKSSTHTVRRFAVYTGDTTDQDRDNILRIINSPDNIHGELCELLMITQAGAEGLDIKNIREVHILEEYWNKTRKIQVIGRAVRYKSHIMLPPEERTVDVYEYIATPPNNTLLSDKYDIVTKTFGKDEYTTVDASLYYLSERREHLLNSFKLAMRESAFDCSINYTHNRDSIGKCRICASTNKPMYYPNIKKHMLPNASNCIEESAKRKATEFIDVLVLGNTYKYDPNKKIVYRSVISNGKTVLYADNKLTKLYLQKANQ
jgi:hypothetical protein